MNKRNARSLSWNFAWHKLQLLLLFSMNLLCIIAMFVACLLSVINHFFAFLSSRFFAHSNFLFVLFCYISSVIFAPILKSFSGGCSYQHNIHSSLNNSINTEHHARTTRSGWRREYYRQWTLSSSGSCLHHLVYIGIHSEVCYKSKQVGVLQGSSQHHWPAGNPTILYITVLDRIQPLSRVISRSKKNCTDF